MRKFMVLPIFFFCAIWLFAQKKLNPTINRDEAQISLFYFSDYYSFNSNNVLGVEAVYRKRWKKHTKLGVGALFSYNLSYSWQRGRAYGALFADITQFAGRRQKWFLSVNAGHGIYKLKYEWEDASTKGFTKTTAGFYYSVAPGYRAIISKRYLLTISPLCWMHRNFRIRSLSEFYSPPATDGYHYVWENNNFAVKIGLAF